MTSVVTADSPSYTFTPAMVKFSNMGIPAHPAYTDYIRQVEMAELQIFLGKTLDPEKTDKRRLFISDEGRPVNPIEAEKFFKRKPDVLLHKSGNWKKGDNTGVLQPITGSDPYDFVPTGEIVTYKPDPSLYGPQGEKPKP